MGLGQNRPDHIHSVALATTVAERFSVLLSLEEAVNFLSTKEWTTKSIVLCLTLRLTFLLDVVAFLYVFFFFFFLLFSPPFVFNFSTLPKRLLADVCHSV